MTLDGDMRKLAEDFIAYGEMRHTSSTSQQLVIHLTEELDQLRAENAALKAERDEARQEYLDLGKVHSGLIVRAVKAEAELASARTEIAALKEGE